MRVLDEEINLKENMRLSLRKNAFLWVIFLITAIVDFLTTLLFMYHSGIHHEKNLVVQWLATTIGIIPGVFIGKSLQALSAVGFSTLSYKLSTFIIIVFIVVNCLAIYINLGPKVMYR